MVTRETGSVHSMPPKPSGSGDGKPPLSAGWRPSEDHERLSPAIWIGGFMLMVAILALMAALFGAG